MRRTLTWVTIFAVAMGVLEGALVVYIRRLYWPGGFGFPMPRIDTDVAVIELWRELATLAMLLAVGMLAGRNRSERFAYFIYNFGLWDLTYYAFLKVSLGWPASLLAWDILFLLPVPWFGPVLAPCIVAITMCGIALTAIRITDRGGDASMTPRERGLLVIGALVIVVSFTIDWAFDQGPTLWRNIAEHRDLLYGLGFVPKTFQWWIFALGESIGIAAWMSYARRLSVSPRQS
jgi:hypothetical protein